MKKEEILEELRARGGRITKQRLLLLDVILSGECECCKEIYYKASKSDSTIGMATVYRMVNILEEMGAIDRKLVCRGISDEENEFCRDCTVYLEDETTISVTADKWNRIITAGLNACGYLNGQEIKCVVANV